MYPLSEKACECYNREFNLLFVNRVKDFPDFFSPSFVGSSCLQLFNKIGILKNYAKFIEEAVVWRCSVNHRIKG